ncbi:MULTISPECIES: hypothetical protein [Pyrococcus]|uniref:hypothetical protein n=1 Tax=Pyrococcus TaxID=2260 RepID=UPI00373AF344
MLGLRWVIVLLLGFVVLGSFGSAGNDKACQPVKYWVFENGQWVEKSEPRIWWYCQEPEKIKNFEGFAFKEKPYGLLKKPESIILHQAARELSQLVGIDELNGESSRNLSSYGGMFIDEKRGLIFIYIKNEEDKQKIKQKLEKYKRKINIIFLKGKYNFADLVRWKHMIERLNVSVIKQLGIVTIDADEAHNTLTIGLANVTLETLKILEKELEKLGIPKEAVRVEEEGYIKLTTNSDFIRPLIGGIKQNRELRGTGTLGYVGYYKNIKGSVYCSYRNSAAELYGINWGKPSSGSIYSPIDGIEKDLGISLTVTYN